MCDVLLSFSNNSNSDNEKNNSDGGVVEKIQIQFIRFNAFDPSFVSLYVIIYSIVENTVAHHICFNFFKGFAYFGPTSYVIPSSTRTEDHTFFQPTGPFDIAAVHTNSNILLLNIRLSLKRSRRPSLTTSILPHTSTLEQSKTETTKLLNHTTHHLHANFDNVPK